MSKRDKAHGKIFNVFDEYIRVESAIECLAFDLECEAKKIGTFTQEKSYHESSDAWEAGYAAALEGIAEKLRDIIKKPCQ